jgi:hypothetical protein
MGRTSVAANDMKFMQRGISAWRMEQQGLKPFQVAARLMFSSTISGG